jgi:Bacterial protein of unknown function (DUF885)
MHRFLFASTLPVLLAFMFSLPACGQRRQVDEAFQNYSSRFWQWRAETQPVSGDDITRIERPDGWNPDWSPSAVDERRQAYRELSAEWEDFDTTGWSVPAQVDYRLVGSALARVEWEMDISAGWSRNPLFYIKQTLGSVFEELLVPAPFDADRSSRIVDRLFEFGPILRAARLNLTRPVRAFAELAISGTREIPDQLTEVSAGLSGVLTGPDAERLEVSVDSASAAISSYGEWLQDNLSGMETDTAVGPEAYAFFLRRVALMPYSADELVAMARREFERAVSFESIERQKNAAVPELPLFPDQVTQAAETARREAEVRIFLEEKGILSIPDWVHHYGNAPVPAYLAPLSYMGVIDDLTSVSRLDENALKYVFPPSRNLGYFHLSMAKDPRPILVHEGIPGHYLQLVLSWAHENPIRRHYYDSGANEGIGFYAEELMLQAGFFDDSPRTREIIYNYMRLRALRVEVDVKLATGVFTIAEAADYLVSTVPMDRQTAGQEAAFFASAPGQAISYQIGKSQIIAFLSDARRALGEQFNLQAFHDNLWLNGNVPIALQRWEYLGLRDEIEMIDSR